LQSVHLIERREFAVDLLPRHDFLVFSFYLHIVAISSL
jgi:hypothetical protein